MVRDLKMAHMDLPCMGFPAKLGPARKRLAFSGGVAADCRILPPPHLVTQFLLRNLTIIPARADKRPLAHQAYQGRQVEHPRSAAALANDFGRYEGR
jgi:hypothetical protein